MRTNGLEQPEGFSIESLEHSSDFKALPTITTEDMEIITNDAASDFVYVDWYNGSSSSPSLTMSKPLIATMSKEKPPQVFVINMTWDKINAILDKFVLFDVEHLCHSNGKKLLDQLNPLVAPLASLTKPGQMLVFSAVDRLHRVPLHALCIGGDVLIRRNPVVYSSSMTVLNVAFQNVRLLNRNVLIPTMQLCLVIHPRIEASRPSPALPRSFRPNHTSMIHLLYRTSRWLYETPL